MTIAITAQNAQCGMGSFEAKRMAELERPDPHEAELLEMLDDLLSQPDDDTDEVDSDSRSLPAVQVDAKEVKAGETGEVLVSPATALVAHYEFPETALRELDYEHLNDDILKQALLELVEEAAPYHAIRDRYTAIACIMNRRGVCPPKFRPQRSLPRRKKEANDNSELMMLDRQVIDMHWLHCRGKREILPGKEFANLFVDSELDFNLAGWLDLPGDFRTSGNLRGWLP